jgi:elongation factor P
MVLASDAKAGMAIQLEGKIYKILEAVRHSGSGQMHGFIELKLKDLKFGHFADRRFKHTDRLEEVELVKRQMEYLYSDAGSSYFMDPSTFDQLAISNSTIGDGQKLMKEGMKVTVELLGEDPVSVQMPKVAELRVMSTGPGLRGAQDNTMKAATLENGMELLVPHFVETGEVVRVDTEKMKYIDRITLKKI